MAMESAPGSGRSGRHRDAQAGTHSGGNERVRHAGGRLRHRVTDRFLPDIPPRVLPSDRAQTTQDFAVGASIFLLVLAGTVAFLPNIFAPYDQQVGSAERQQATRVADALVSEDPYTSPGNPGTLSYTTVHNQISSDTLLSNLRERTGVRDSRISIVVYTRPGLTRSTIVHENDEMETPFEPDGGASSTWTVVPGSDPIDRFEMTINSSTLPTATPGFEVNIGGTDIGMHRDSGTGQVTVGSCAPSLGNVQKVDIDFVTGNVEMTDADGNAESCTISSPLSSNPDNPHQIKFVPSGGGDFANGSYRIVMAEQPSTFADRNEFDSSSDYPETSVVKIDSGQPLATESQPWTGQASVTVRRLVTFDDPATLSDECDPVCEVVVRVW